jgi:hypothetical protein
MGVTIETPQIKMEITLVSIDALFIHEETIPAALEQLKQELMEEKTLHHPMIVDSKTLVVLDGMHRVAALRNLNYKLAPVCLIDYQNPAIELSAWYREFDGKVTFSNFAGSLSHHLSVKSEEITTDKAIELVNSRKAIAALAFGDQAFVFTTPTPLSIKATYDEIAKTESFAQQSRIQIVYSTEKDAIESIKNQIRPALIVPSLTKKEVVESALKRELFTPKTTRHVVPARPLFVNVPLAWLKDKDLKNATKRLIQHLEKKRIIEQNSGIVINGRRYEERAYIFTDP